MKVRSRMTAEIRKKIKMYIKNRMDISPLIEDYMINGENLAGSIIKTINRINENITNTNFANCVIGNEENISNFMGSNLKGSNFTSAVFKGTVWFRHCDLRNCNFNKAVLTDVQYQHSDLRNITICDTVIRMGSRTGFGAKFEWKQFLELSKYLNLDVQK